MAVLDELEKAIKTKETARKVIFDEYISPFFKDASDICEDALNFYLNFGASVNEIMALDPSERDNVLALVKSVKPEMMKLRQGMLLRRIQLERKGDVLTSIRWTDDAELELALSELVSNVLWIIRAYDGKGSRPKTLVDALDLLERSTDPQDVLAAFGGVAPLIEAAQSHWSRACQTYEQIRVYVIHGIYPKEWGSSTVLVVRRRSGLRRAAKVALGLILLLAAVIGAINTIGTRLRDAATAIETGKH